MGRARVLTAIAVAAGTLAAAVLIGLVGGQVAPYPERVAAFGDTFVLTAAPDQAGGAETYLPAGGYNGGAAISYLKFDVVMPAGHRPWRAWLWLGRESGELPDFVELTQVPDANWSETGLTAASAPRLGRVVSSLAPHKLAKAVAFNITDVLAASGRYAFALTAPTSTQLARFVAREARGTQTGAPTITFEWTEPTPSTSSTDDTSVVAAQDPSPSTEPQPFPSSPEPSAPTDDPIDPQPTTWPSADPSAWPDNPGPQPTDTPTTGPDPWPADPSTEPAPTVTPWPDASPTVIATASIAASAPSDPSPADPTPADPATSPSVAPGEPTPGVPPTEPSPGVPAPCEPSPGSTGPTPTASTEPAPTGPASAEPPVVPGPGDPAQSASPSAEPSAEPSPSDLPIPAPESTADPSADPSPSDTPSPSPDPGLSPDPNPGPSPSPGSSPDPSSDPSPSPSPDPAPSPSPDADSSASPSPTPSPSPSPWPSSDPSPNPSPSPSPSPSPWPSPWTSSDPSPSPTVSPSSDISPSPDLPPGPEPSTWPSPSPSPSTSSCPSPSPSPSPSSSPSPSPSADPGITPDPSPSSTPDPGTGPGPNPSPDPTPTESPSPSPTVSPGDSPSPTPSPSDPASPSPSPSPSGSPSPSASPSPSPSPNPSPSASPSPTVSPRPSSSDSPKPTASPSPSPQICRLGDKLVPTCGLLWGVAPGAHTRIARSDALIAFEKSVSRPQAIFHNYHRGDQMFPTAEEIRIARDPRTPRILYLNWKPLGATWSQIAHGDSDIDDYLDRLATYINRNFNEPFFFTVHHEPEDDVRANEGSGMTATDYAAAYRYVIKRLRARGVDNMVTTMSYMAYIPWNVKPWFEQLYPGDDVVDWIAWDIYAYSDPGYGYGDFAEMVNRRSGSRPGWPGFYVWAAQKFPTKPLMLGEWGVWYSEDNPGHQADLFESARLQLELFPRVKAYIYFESPNAEGRDSRVDVTAAGQAAFRRLSWHPAFNVVLRRED